MFGRKNKIVTKVLTKEGMEIKVWANSKTGVVVPTNWKQQAGFLAGPAKMTKRLQNRMRRRLSDRASYNASLRMAVAS